MAYDPRARTDVDQVRDVARAAGQSGAAQAQMDPAQPSPCPRVLEGPGPGPEVTNLVHVVQQAVQDSGPGGDKVRAEPWVSRFGPPPPLNACTC